MKYTDFVGQSRVKITSKTLEYSWDIFSKNIKASLADVGGSHFQKAKYLNKIVPDYQSFVTHIRFFIDNWNDNPLFTESFTSEGADKKRLAIGQDEDGGMIWLKGQPATNISDILLVVASCPDIYEELFPKEVKLPPEPKQEEPPKEPRYTSYDDDAYYYGYD
jgi:hypothetical protein